MSSSMKYAVTVAGLVLAVIALGNLLNHRPNNGERWTDVDHDSDTVSMVIRNVVLVALLSLFDLALTLLAHQAGGFLELNPLSDRLLGDSFHFVLFKVTTLSVACLILVMIRKHRLAQMASWWLCLVCTVLTFRWLTFNSIFLA
jgi:hypothetical protein